MKYILFLVITLISSLAFSQNNDDFAKRLKAINNQTIIFYNVDGADFSSQTFSNDFRALSELGDSILESKQTSKSISPDDRYKFIGPDEKYRFMHYQQKQLQTLLTAKINRPSTTIDST